jgi:hypothetical protein
MRARSTQAWIASRKRASFGSFVGLATAILLIAAPANAALTFGPVVRITPPAEVGDYASDLARAGSSLVFVYSRDVDSENFELKDYAVRRSTDHGSTWTAPKVLVTSAAEPGLWGVAGSSSTMVALFTQTGNNNVRSLMLYRSANGGASWSALKIASRTDPYYRFGQASVAVDGNDVYVTWVEVDATKVKLRHSSNGGASFGPTATIGSLVYGDGSPRVAVSGNTVYVLWSKYCNYVEGYCAGGMKTILLRRSLDGGATWKPVQTLTTGTWYLSQQIGVSGKQLLVFGEYDQFHLWRSNDSGATFHGQTIAATGTYRDADGVAIAGTQARLVWTNTGTGVAYYRSSGDGGATWGPNIKLTSFNGFFVEYSAVALVSGHTVVVTHCSTDNDFGWCDATS